MKTVAVALVSVFLISSGLPPGDRAQAATAESCGRACLYGLMDQYLKALVAHDPSKLPLATNVKFTENTNTMKLGDGLWQTLNSLGSYTLYAADQYFNGIEQGNGDIVPFDDDCVRIENGRQTAPSTAAATGALAGRPAMTPRQQFNSKAFNYITEVTHRRYLVIDEENGIVFGTFMFAHPGNVPAPDWASTGLPPNPMALSAYPNTTQIIEAFKVRSGKLYRIFAYVSLLPYRQSPGW